MVSICSLFTDGNDRAIGTYRFRGVLTVGATYDNTASFTVQNAIYGNFSIIVLTDSNNEVYEYVDEEDNSLTSLVCE